MFGTAILILLGVGVVANVALARTNGFDGGFLMVAFGWGLAVFADVYVAYESGAHLNPAVTLGLVASGHDLGGDGSMGDTAVRAAVYISAQIIGAILDAVAAWAAYRDHFNTGETDAATKLGASLPVRRSPTRPATS